MSLEYIRKNYQVPASRGQRITFFGGDDIDFGTIVGSTRATAHLRVRLDNDPTRIHSLHPTWKVHYGDLSGLIGVRELSGRDVVGIPTDQLSADAIEEILLGYDIGSDHTVIDFADAAQGILEYLLSSVVTQGAEVTS